MGETFFFPSLIHSFSPWPHQVEILINGKGGLRIFSFILEHTFTMQGKHIHFRCGFSKASKKQNKTYANCWDPTYFLSNEILVCLQILTILI